MTTQTCTNLHLFSLKGDRDNQNFMTYKSTCYIFIKRAIKQNVSMTFLDTCNVVEQLIDDV